MNNFQKYLLLVCTNCSELRIKLIELTKTRCRRSFCKSCIELSHLKQPHNTKESCPFPNARQSNRESNKEKSSKEEKSIHQSNQNVSKQINRSSTSRGTMIDCDNWIVENEMSIEDRASPMNPISDDNGTLNGTGEVQHDGIASRRSSLDRKRSADCPKRINEDDMLSQVNKKAKQIGEVIEIDFAASKLKYSARVHPKKSEKIARLRSDIEKSY